MANGNNQATNSPKLGALLRSGDPEAARMLGARGGKASHSGQNNSNDNEPQGNQNA